jgi:hypothetical protein
VHPAPASRVAFALLRQLAGANPRDSKLPQQQGPVRHSFPDGYGRVPCKFASPAGARMAARAARFLVVSLAATKASSAVTQLLVRATGDSLDSINPCNVASVAQALVILVA